MATASTASFASVEMFFLSFSIFSRGAVAKTIFSAAPERLEEKFILNQVNKAKKLYPLSADKDFWVSKG